MSRVGRKVLGDEPEDERSSQKIAVAAVQGELLRQSRIGTVPEDSVSDDYRCRPSPMP